MAPRASEVAHTVTVFTAWLTCLPAAEPGHVDVGELEDVVVGVRARRLVIAKQAGICARWAELSVPEVSSA